MTTRTRELTKPACGPPSVLIAALLVAFVACSSGPLSNFTCIDRRDGTQPVTALQNGLMVGDYVAAAFTNGVPHGVFAVSQANFGSTFDQAIYIAQGLSASAAGRQSSSAQDRPLHKLSDPIEKEIPERGVPPERQTFRRQRK